MEKILHHFGEIYDFLWIYYILYNPFVHPEWRKIFFHQQYRHGPNHVLPSTSFFIGTEGLDGVPLPFDGADDELELGAGPGCAPVGKCAGIGM